MNSFISSSIQNLRFFATGDSTMTHIPTWVSIVVVTTIIFLFGFYYQHHMESKQAYDDLPTIVFLTFTMIQWINKTTYQMLGKQYRMFVPFFIYIILYFWLSSIVSIIGLPTMGASLEIPATISLIVFIGTIATSIYFKRWKFASDYVIWFKVRKHKIFPIVDPLKIIGEFSKIISLTCRLWGNCLAGSLILFVCYYSIDSLFTSFQTQWLSIFVIPSIVFPLHIYFDIIDGAIQSLIFMLLTISYWAIASKSETPNSHEH